MFTFKGVGYRYDTYVESFFLYLLNAVIYLSQVPMG